MPGRVIYRDGQRINEKLPDIEAEAIKSLKNRIEVLETLLRQLQGDNATNLASDSINQSEQDKLDWLDGNTENESTEERFEVFWKGAGS